MYENGRIYMGLAGDKRVEMVLKMCNRHGLISGASGTGKTVTMKVMAESFSDAGVPVFMCDVKGDVAGICAPGQSTEDMEKRIDRFGLRETFTYKEYPTTFWDIYQEGGHPIRVTVSEMGPELLSRILGLTDVQEGILHIVFRIADDKGLLLTDLKDLRVMLNYVSEHRSEYMMTYGNITPQSVAAILRALLPLEQQGGDLFFGEPALDIQDWIRTDAEGRGMINVLDSVKLVQNPTLYATFLLWLLSELFESLPESGDLDKPRLVFFFDEAHTLFRDVPKVLLQKIEQTVKLIRSRGVGVYFVTQSPSDIPDTVLAQLSNRVQHALRAYTPAELKAVRTAAQTFRANPEFQTEDAIMELGVGGWCLPLLPGRRGRADDCGAHENHLSAEFHGAAGSHVPFQSHAARRHGEVRRLRGQRVRLRGVNGRGDKSRGRRGGGGRPQNPRKRRGGRREAASEGGRGGEKTPSEAGGRGAAPPTETGRSGPSQEGAPTGKSGSRCPPPGRSD